jgi:hypothetical protein
MLSNPSIIVNEPPDTQSENRPANIVRSAYRRLGEWDVRCQNHVGSGIGYGPTISVSAGIHTGETLNNFSLQLPFAVALALGEVLAELAAQLEEAWTVPEDTAFEIVGQP